MDYIQVPSRYKRTNYELNIIPQFFTWPCFHDWRLQKVPFDHKFYNTEKNYQIAKNCSLLQFWFKHITENYIRISAINVEENTSLRAPWNITKYIINNETYILVNLETKMRYDFEEFDDLYKWYDASSICRKHGGDLMSPFTVSDVHLILDVVKFNKAWTISLYLGVFRKVINQEIPLFVKSK